MSLSGRRQRKTKEFTCKITIFTPQLDRSKYVGEVEIISNPSNGNLLLKTTQAPSPKEPNHNPSEYSNEYKRLTKIYIMNAFPFLEEELVDNYLRNFNYSLINTFKYFKEKLFFSPKETLLDGKEIKILGKNRNTIELKPEKDGIFLEEVLYLEETEEKESKEEEKAFMNFVISSAAEYFNEETCTCCVCRKNILSTYAIIPSCKNKEHSICKSCFPEVFNEMIIKNFVCFHCKASNDCPGIFSLDDIRSVISPDQFISFISSYRRRTMAELIKSDNLKGWKCCPSCNEYSPAESGNSSMFVCRNIKCKHALCNKCGGDVHYGQDCPIALREQEFINTVSQAMDLARSPSCPYCGVPCSKKSNCNHINCIKCGAQFCYLCRALLAKPGEEQNYDHFFKYNICDLQCNTKEEDQKRMDEERARIAGQKAADEWRKKNQKYKDFKLPEIFNVK